MPSEEKFSSETMVTLIQVEGKNKHRSFEIQRILSKKVRKN
jgi:hypothetical protein